MGSERCQGCDSSCRLQDLVVQTWKEKLCGITHVWLLRLLIMGSFFEDEEVPFDLATRIVDLDQHLSKVCSARLPSYDRPLEQPSKLISY